MDKSSKFFDQIEIYIIIVMMIIMVTLTFFTVCSRFIFSFTFSWAEQLERLAMIYMFFAGMSWAGKIDAHYKVTVSTLIFKKHPKILNSILMLGDLLGVAFGIYMSFLIADVTLTLMKQGPVLASMPWVPKWLQYLPGVFGMAGFSLRVLQRLYKNYIDEKGGV